MTKIRRQIDAVAQQATTVTQQALAKTATLVAAVPVQARKAVKLAAKAESLVGAPLETLQVAATLSANRLQAASEAESFDALIKGQVALFPATKSAALAETRKYLTLFFDAKERIDAAVKAKALAWVTPKIPKARKVAAQETAAA